MSGTAINSYFDKTILGIETPAEQARTTEQMFQKSTYKGWDFDTTWTIEEGKNYPTLRFLKNINTEEPTQKQLKVVLEPKEQLQLSADEDFDENQNMTWVSSNPKIAAVSANGLVNAIKKGTTTITIQSADKSYTEVIKVLIVKDVRKYRLIVDLKVGRKCRLTIDDAQQSL